MHRFKKWTVILLCVALVVTLVACDKKPDEPDPTDPPVTEAPGPTDAPEPTDPPEPPAGVTLDNIKLGFVHITDPSDMGYTYNHNLGTEKMAKEL